MPAGGIKFRQYEKLAQSTKPLIVGWAPSKEAHYLIMNFREEELPGYRLYNLQISLPGWRGQMCGRLFGLLYADRKITIAER